MTAGVGLRADCGVWIRGRQVDKGEEGVGDNASSCDGCGCGWSSPKGARGDRRYDGAGVECTGAGGIEGAAGYVPGLINGTRGGFLAA